jgi:hypothetical protein
LAYEPDVASAVLSGAGGYLAASVLDKTKPVNVAGALRLAMADPRVNLHHPMVNLMQLVYEEVDSVNYGRALFSSPVSGVGRKSIFLGMGMNDHYTPPLSISALAYVMRIRRVTQDAARCGDKVCTGSETCVTCSQDCGQCLSGGTCGDKTCEKDKGETCRNCPTDCTCYKTFSEVAAPVKGNEGPGTAPVTAAMVQYVSHDGSYDDHFVLFQEPTGKIQANHFLGSGVWNKDHVPTIPAKK